MLTARSDKTVSVKKSEKMLRVVCHCRVEVPGEALTVLGVAAFVKKDIVKYGADGRYISSRVAFLPFLVFIE